MHTRHKHTTSASRNTHTSHTRSPTALRLTIQTENTTSITSPTQTHNILQHSKDKTTIFNNGATQQTDLHTVTTTDIYTNMCHMHTSVLSRHLTKRNNNKLVRTHLPNLAALKRYFPASLVAPFPSSVQIYILGMTDSWSWCQQSSGNLC